MNNLVVSTPLATISDERFGFTESEVKGLAEYLGRGDCVDEIRCWYDGYRFGRFEVYNPWSVLNYFDGGCEPRDYWGNTSGNSVLGGFVSRADARTLETLYRLCEPGGDVSAPLDLKVVFPDADVASPALWSMLYLAGYLTTDEPQHAGEMLLAPYRLRIPSKEVSVLYKREIVDRFTGTVGGVDRYYQIHEAFRTGDSASLDAALCAALNGSTSFYDLISENSAHMLMTGLLYGMPGYLVPRSNGEAGDGRFDLQLCPDMSVHVPSVYLRPLLTIEFKFEKGGVSGDELKRLADSALKQIVDKRYDEDEAFAGSRIRWGVAFSGKHVTSVCERA